MRSDGLEMRTMRARSATHGAALKAAAKVAFSMALLNGCSSADGVFGDEAEGDEAVSSESAVTSGSPKTGAPKRALGKKPCPSEDGAEPAKPSCEATLTAAFPTPGNYQWEPVAQSKDVVACCDEELTKNGAGSEYRWDCCVAYDPTVDPEGRGPRSGGTHGMACTPWGPPVPPSMKRGRRANPEIATWIARAVA
ncbi:MAG: hypothetical protein KF764_29250 [Labilithrix sp.]|nr:hypothetical protein [Labilithrix sp.]